MNNNVLRQFFPQFSEYDLFIVSLLLVLSYYFYPDFHYLNGWFLAFGLLIILLSLYYVFSKRKHNFYDKRLIIMINEILVWLISYSSIVYLLEHGLYQGESFFPHFLASFFTVYLLVSLFINFLSLLLTFGPYFHKMIKGKNRDEMDLHWVDFKFKNAQSKFWHLLVIVIITISLFFCFKLLYFEWSICAALTLSLASLTTHALFIKHNPNVY